MKLNPAGSFSSPDKLAAQMREQQDVSKKAAAGKKATDEVVKNMDAAEPSVEDWPMNEEAPVPEAVASTPAPAAKGKFFQKSPVAMLREIGIEPSEEDFHNLIFRGCIEKEIEVVKNPVTGKPMSAVLKTLTAEEIDLVDELTVEQLEVTKMTNESMEIRRSVWLMSIAVQKLAGRSLVKKDPVDETGKLDVKELARMRRQVLAKLNPFILDRLIGLHTTLVTAYNSILSSDSEGELLKK